MNALEKLNEAAYFLELMQKNIDDLDKFKYNLSAFLSAGRSVTYYLQKEFKENSRFNEWYELKQIEGIRSYRTIRSKKHTCKQCT